MKYTIQYDDEGNEDNDGILALTTLLKVFSNDHLIEELRNRGFAVQVFNTNNLPVWANFNQVREGGAGWLERNRWNFERKLTILGNATLNSMAAEDGIPSLDDPFKETE